MELSKLVSYAAVNEDGTWFTFPDTEFKVKIKLLQEKALTELNKKATSVVRDKASSFRAVTRYDDELFRTLFAKEAIIVWENLNVGVLKSLLPKANIDGEDSTVIECSEANKIWLMANCTDFQNWVTGHVLEVEDHRKEQKEGERANLTNASSGN